MRVAVSYLSTIAEGLPDASAKKLITELETWNNQHGVTGIVLYSDGNFFHMIEGEQETIQHLRKVIENNPNHHSIIKIFEKEIYKKAFDGFKSAVVSAETKYNPKKIKSYTKQLKVLDKKTRHAAEKILETFIASH